MVAVLKDEKRARRKSLTSPGPRGKKKYTRLTQLVTENRYRRPPPPWELPPRELPLPPVLPRLGAGLECGALDEDEPVELPRLCTTDGLIRTAGERLPEEMLPFVPPEAAPLLLPLKRCQLPDVDGGPALLVDPEGAEGVPR
jgi:hypothetical protein